jgi:catechol 2,3-dioxygenase-like lactoylglutathione lyase family enzyme
VGFWRPLGIKLFGRTPVYGKAVTGVKDMERGIAWYSELFDLLVGQNGEGEATLVYPVGRSFIPVITLVQIPISPIRAPLEHHPILFAGNLNKTRDELISKNVGPGPIEEDSVGNHFFAFQDFEGNRIEICLEPGKKLR